MRGTIREAEEHSATDERMNWMALDQLRSARDVSCCRGESIGAGGSTARSPITSGEMKVLPIATARMAVSRVLSSADFMIAPTAPAASAAAMVSDVEYDVRTTILVSGASAASAANPPSLNPRQALDAEIMEQQKISRKFRDTVEFLEGL